MRINLLVNERKPKSLVKLLYKRNSIINKDINTTAYSSFDTVAAIAAPSYHTNNNNNNNNNTCNNKQQVNNSFSTPTPAVDLTPKGTIMK